MRKTPIAALLAGAILAAAPALAVEPAVGARLGTDAAAIAAALAEDGWTVRKFETERRKIEVYAQKDGRRLELDLDPATGEVRRIKEKY